MRNLRKLQGLLGVTVMVGLAGWGKDASACGGEFVPPSQTVDVVSAHRMILSISQDSTTLYDEIEFNGVASSFAWVLPIKGAATVGLSADVLFASLDQLTASQVLQPAVDCPPPPECGDEGRAEDGAGESTASASGGPGSVTVTSQAQVGPYETVQLHSSDPQALQGWLTAHGYAIPTAEAPVVAAYVSEGFDFLAMKLVPGQGVTAMRPVRVTTSGASPVLPLRMVGVGTGSSTSITLWVVASGRYQPQNFPFYVVQDSQLAWDWNTGESNYVSVQKAEDAKLNGSGWQVESSLDINESSVQQLVENTIEFGAGGSGTVSDGYASTGNADAGAASSDAGAIDGSAVDAGAYEDAATVEQDDFNALFAGASSGVVRVTRLRSNISHAALTADLTLEASTDQSQLSNVYNTTSQIGQPECPVYDNSCGVTGEVPRSEAQASASSSSSSASAAARGSSTGGGGCSTAGSQVGSDVGFAALAGFFGFGVLRSRRKRKQS